MENRDRTRDQGSPDPSPGRTTPGHDDNERPDPRRTREDEGREGDRPVPGRNPQPERPAPKTA